MTVTEIWATGAQYAMLACAIACIGLIFKTCNSHHLWRQYEIMGPLSQVVLPLDDSQAEMSENLEFIPFDVLI